MSTKILSVNPNKSMNYLIQTVVSAHHKVVTSSNINDGLKQLKKQKDIELIVIDIDYSAEKNLGFLEYMGNSATHSRPVIILASEADSFKFIPERISYMSIIKPFDPIQLINAINQLTKTPLVNI